MYKDKIKCLCIIFAISFTLKLRDSFLKSCNKSDSIWTSRVGFNSAIKYTSKILRVNFLNGAFANDWPTELVRYVAIQMLSGVWFF